MCPFSATFPFLSAMYVPVMGLFARIGLAIFSVISFSSVHLSVLLKSMCMDRGIFITFMLSCLCPVFVFSSISFVVAFTIPMSWKSGLLRYLRFLVNAMGYILYFPGSGRLISSSSSISWGIMSSRSMVSCPLFTRFMRVFQSSDPAIVCPMRFCSTATVELLSDNSKLPSLVMISIFMPK